MGFRLATLPLLGVLGVIATILAASGYVLYRFYDSTKKAQEEARMAQDKLAQAQGGFSRRIGGKIVEEFRYGNFDMIQGEGMNRLKRFLETVPFASTIAGYDKMTREQQIEANQKANKDFIEEVMNAQYNRIRFDRASPYESKPNALDLQSVQLLEDLKKLMSEQKNITIERIKSAQKAEEDAKVENAQQFLRRKEIQQDPQRMIGTSKM